jgi:hypothetical protein
MKGYIYTMFKGADPGQGWTLTDPIFGPVPTMGACMTNIRRAVTEGDYIFVISGRVQGVKQYLVGGFQVDKKIDALAAYRRFPQNRQRRMPDGTLRGNVIVDSQGRQNPIDYHSNFERRVENYIVGKNPILIETPHQTAIAREQTLGLLSEVFRARGKKVSDIISRWRRLDQEQIERLREWLLAMKNQSRMLPE